VDQSAGRKDTALIARLTATAANYLDAFGDDVARMFPTLGQLSRAPWGRRIDTSAWPEVLADGLAAVAAGGRRAARDHLIALYVNRMLSFWDEIAQHSSAEVDALLDRQARETHKAVAGRALVFGGREPADDFSRGLWHRFV
jgi:glucosylglycerate synthase